MNKKELSIIGDIIAYADRQQSAFVNNPKQFEYYLGIEIGLKMLLQEVRKKNV